MNDETGSRKRASLLWLAAASVLAVGALCSPPTLAQPRFYWKTLSGANAVPLIVTSASGNTNPFDPALTVAPGANIDATVSMFGYARTFSVGNRAAMASVVLPMGRISGDVGANGQTLGQATSGFGDPMFEFDVNLVGPPAQNTLVDAMRYEPKFSLDVIVDLAVPIGEYNSSQALNIGQNRWYGRLGAPMVWQLGPWVPGRRTTLEFLPAAWWFTTNDNYDGGKTLTTDPLYELDAHLTRDFNEHLWGSLDGVWYNGGQSSIDGVKGEKLDNLAFGLTLGYQLNENVTLMFGYKSTVADSAPTDLRMDGFTVTLLSGWHALVEGARRLKKE
jgi:hypothetical protein